MVIGGLAALVHGAGWPALNLFFGDLIDEFIDFDTNTTLPTLPPGVTYPPIDPMEEFDKQMRKYALIFTYVGIAVVFASYIQVGIASRNVAIVLPFSSSQPLSSSSTSS